MSEAGDGSGKRSRRPVRILALILLGAALLGGGFAAGWTTTDDATEVRQLRSELDEQRDGRERAESRADAAEEEAGDLTEANTELTESNDRLKDRLEAEQNLKGAGGSSAASGAAPDAELQVGQAATVGDYTLKPTQVVKRSNGFRATVTVKNNGSESDSPLCGGGATLIDDGGRSFDGDAYIGDNSDACEDLQPGLTGTILVDFKTPPDAEAAVLELSPDVLGGDESESWAITSD